MRRLLLIVGASSIVPVVIAITDTIITRLIPQPILLSGLGWFQFFTASAGIYFFVSILISFALSPLFLVTKFLPGFKGKEPEFVYTIFGASLNLIPLVILFEVADKYDTGRFLNPIAVAIIIVAGLLSIAFSAYIVPFAVLKLKEKTARSVNVAASAIVFGCLGIVLLSFSYTSTKPFFKPSFDASAPNLLVISIDTLRKDHVSFYDYDEIETPNIDGFILGSTRFDSAFCSSPWTFPSFSSYLTGLEPSVCGVDHLHKLSNNIETFPQILHRNGYRTECYNSNWSMYPEYGFGKGFDVYMDWDSIPYLSSFRGTRLYFHIRRINKIVPIFKKNPYRYEADFISDVVSNSLDNGSERPFFIWCNFFDPHSHYYPPPEYIEGNKADYDELLRRAAPAYFLPLDSPDLDIEVLTELYDGEIAHVDDEIGRILKALDETGHSDDTIVIIFNDHGEAFQEHGMWGHGFDVYPELTDMLLAVRDPFRDKPNPVSNKYVSHIDIMPTILEMLGLETLKGIQGRSFYAELFRLSDISVPVLSEFTMEKFGEVKGIRRDGFLFVKDWGNGSTALYNLSEDPTAGNDVSGNFPDIAEDLNLEMDEAIEQNEHLRYKYSGHNEIELSDSDKSKLKHIGYLGN